MPELLQRWTYDLLAKGVCPDCLMPGMVPGPRGGLSRNEACANCGSEFNVGRFGGEVIVAHRNSEPGEPNMHRLRQVFGISLP